MGHYHNEFLEVLVMEVNTFLRLAFSMGSITHYETITFHKLHFF